MNKARLEGLSDASFAIIFTLLVIEIRVPEHILDMSSLGLWKELHHLAPLFIGYIVSFLVIAMFWISHSFFYSSFVKTVDRPLVGLNLLYLMFLAIIPFSSHLLGRYPDVPLAMLWYGINVLAIGVMAILTFKYALYSHEIDTAHNSPRLIAQAQVRQYLTVGSTVVGILCIPVSQWLTLFFYAFPVVFNVIPGFLNKMERMFGFKLGGTD